MKTLVRRIVPFPVRARAWRIRRNVPRVARRCRWSCPSPSRRAGRILVIGCPRAGTSALLDLLLRSPELGSVHSEGHILWDPYHHPRDRGWDSDALGRSDVSDRERAYIYRAVMIRLVQASPRFVDKTAENCLGSPTCWSCSQTRASSSCAATRPGPSTR